MKILLLNGSPRIKGNTSFALRTIADGIEKNTEYEVELVELAKLKIGGCTDCRACKDNGGICVIPDDGAALVEKVYEADVIVFGTPVYWWGVSSQLKAAIDRLYSKSASLKTLDKKIGVVAIGASALSNRQYELIHGQFECICNYLGWDCKFSLSYSAKEADDLKGSEKAVAELSDAWKLL